MNASTTKAITWAEEYVREYMSHYDASHDYTHIQRVLHNAKIIEAKERFLHPNTIIDSDIITLAALLHDVEDRKYTDQAGNRKHSIQDLLITAGCPTLIASKIQLICTHVSYFHETQNPDHVAALCAEIPELGIVQDADRLDAIGAVGIARMFVYTGAKQGERGLSVQHFHEKLLRIEGRMKTRTGRAMARERTERMRVYLGWYGEEMEAVDGVGEGKGGSKQEVLMREKVVEGKK